LVCGQEGSISAEKGDIERYELCFETERPKAPKPKNEERHVA